MAAPTQSPFGRPAQRSQPSFGGSSGTAAKNLDLRPGDRVNHDKYGLGTVMEITNSKPAPTVMVDFGSKGTVRIMLLGNIPMEKL